MLGLPEPSRRGLCSLWILYLPNCDSLKSSVTRRILPLWTTCCVNIQMKSLFRLYFIAKLECFFFLFLKDVCLLNIFKLLANFFRGGKNPEANVKLVAAESWRIRCLPGKLTELINLRCSVLYSLSFHAPAQAESNYTMALLILKSPSGRGFSSLLRNWLPAD